MLNGLDLFSGIGGISEGLKQWVRPVAYCERERYAQSVLLSRMQSGELNRVPIWDDVRTLHGFKFEAKIDIIFGGFPCQDISVAGNGVGLDGQRSGLFFEILRLVKEIQPTFVFLENVAAIRTRGLDRVCFELAALGYDLRWTIVSAAEVGAPHLRERWFLLAHTASERFGEAREFRCDKYQERFTSSSETMANSLCEGLERLSEPETKESVGQIKTCSNGLSAGEWWSFEPSVGRVANGIPNRVDRIKCLGNAVVPLQAKVAFEKLMGLNHV